MYSWNGITQEVYDIAQQLADIRHQIHYAVKACPILAFLHRLAQLGVGFDIVSVSELEQLIVFRLSIQFDSQISAEAHFE